MTNLNIIPEIDSYLNEYGVEYKDADRPARETGKAREVRKKAREFRIGLTEFVPEIVLVKRERRNKHYADLCFTQRRRIIKGILKRNKQWDRVPDDLMRELFRNFW